MFLLNNQTIRLILSIKKNHPHSGVSEGKKIIWLIEFDLPSFIWQHRLIIKLVTNVGILVSRVITSTPKHLKIPMIVSWLRLDDSTLISSPASMVFFGPRFFSWFSMKMYKNWWCGTVPIGIRHNNHFWNQPKVHTISVSTFVSMYREIIYCILRSIKILGIKMYATVIIIDL